MTDPVPTDLVEVINGVLAVSFLWMLVFVVYHLADTWKCARDKFGGRWGRLRAVRFIYRENKPEIALMTICFALSGRSFLLWYFRWAKNHQTSIILENKVSLLITLSGLLIIGVCCWIRVISPFQGRSASLLWIAMVASSLLFGMGMHYWF